MDDNETKTCTNCKRDIPSDNYTIHSLHCARNIRTCNVCKEPVPTAELQEHHNNFHKIVPCKQCGEGVCGTDLEDHIRDSCGLTLRECRHCSLELPRTDIPPHEQYCGARTERCPDCHEIVMIKYQQLHLESNHSFLKLSDEPGPSPSWMAPDRNSPKLVLRPFSVPTPAVTKKISNAHSNLQTSSGNNQLLEGMFANLDLGPTGDLSSENSAASSSSPGLMNSEASTRNSGALGFPRHSRTPGPSGDSVPSTSRGEAVKKRTNDMPQLNSSQDNAESKIVKEIANYRRNSGKNPGHSSKSPGVKKRQAPKPPSLNPRPPPPPNPTRDLVLQNAILRRQQEDCDRAEQIARHQALGLAPPLTTAEKLKHLRNLSALQNGEFPIEDQVRHTRNSPNVLPEQRMLTKKSQNAVRYPKKQYNPISAREFEERLANRGSNWQNDNQNNSSQINETKNTDSRLSETSSNFVDVRTKAPTSRNLNSKVTNATANIKVDTASAINTKNLNVKKNVASTSGMHRRPEVSVASSSGMNAKNGNIKNSNVRAQVNGVQTQSGEVTSAFPDRFSSIKNELRQLRRGLNEVTAPYNSPGSSAAQMSSANDLEPLRHSNVTSPPSSHPAAWVVTGRPPANPEASGPPVDRPTPSQWDYIADEQYSDLCNVELPCEFCHQMISANDLVLHESGCRMGDTQSDIVTGPTSDCAANPLASGQTSSPSYPHQVQTRPHTDPYRQVEESHRLPEDQLPCEFCHDLFGMSRLMAHQDVCQFH